MLLLMRMVQSVLPRETSSLIHLVKIVQEQQVPWQTKQHMVSNTGLQVGFHAAQACHANRVDASRASLSKAYHYRSSVSGNRL